MTQPLDRRSFLALSAGALAAAAAACGGGSKKSAGSGSSGAPSTAQTTTTAPPVAPLTGLPLTDPTLAARPALVVKIDNADSGSQTARPQTGIDLADVVFEEMVEGSVTRFAAVFQSTDADPVGPIRSGRDTDIDVFSALNHPLFAWSGGAPEVAASIRSSPIVDVGYDVESGAYYRSKDRKAPHNLYSHTPQLYAAAAGKGGTPPALFTYRAAGQPLPATAQATNGVHLEYGAGPGSAPVDYTWDPSVGGWARAQRGVPHTVESGAPIAPANVIVQLVEYFPNGGTDVVGTPVYQAKLVSSGDAWVFTNGQLIVGKWNKPAPETPTSYVDATGAPIALTPGRTWVSLCPIGGGTLK